MKPFARIIIIALVLAGLAAAVFLMVNKNTGTGIADSGSTKKLLDIVPDYQNSRYKEIYLAGGCFWGVQAYFDRVSGVEYTQAGYANGKSDKTDYNSIPATGHAETVYVAYDPEKLPLEELLGYFYTIIDPTSLNRQGNDRGTQYRSGIYYVDPEDRKTIEAATEKAQSGYTAQIVTEIEPLANYVSAEDYHQDYIDKNPDGYCHVNLNEIPKEKPRVRQSDYPKPSAEEIRNKLTDLQWKITQEGATEPSFDNAYLDNKEAGLYVDIVTGEPLFLTIHQYDAGSGWPAFTRPIQWNVLTYRDDTSAGMNRIEVRSASGDSHLGHVFRDGPAEEGGLHYCINSGALDLIALDEMEARGYGAYTVLF